MPTIPDATTSTIINDLLKVMLTPEISDQWKNEFILLNIVEPKAAKRTGGGRSNQVEFPLRTRPSTHVAGVNGEMGQKARISAGGYDQALVKVYMHNMRGAFGKIGKRLTRRDVQGLRSVVEAAMKDVQDGFPNAINKQLYMDETGILAKVSNVATNAITLYAEDEDDAGVFGGGRYIEPGMWFGGTSGKTDTEPDTVAMFQAAAFNETTRVITAQSGVGDLAAEDFIFPEGMLNNCCDGLFHGISDATATVTFGGATYIGIDRAANPYWKGNKLDLAGATTAGILEESLVKLITTISKRRGQNKVPTVALCEPEVYNYLWKEMKDGGRDFQIIVKGRSEGRRYGGGFSGIDVATPYGKGEMTFFPDPQIPKARLALIDPKWWAFVTAGDQDTKYGGWDRTSNGSMFEDIQGTYGMAITWNWMMNFITTEPACQGELIDCPRLT